MYLYKSPLGDKEKHCYNNILLNGTKPQTWCQFSLLISQHLNIRKNDTDKYQKWDTLAVV